MRVGFFAEHRQPFHQRRALALERGVARAKTGARELGDFAGAGLLGRTINFNCMLLSTFQMDSRSCGVKSVRGLSQRGAD